GRPLARAARRHALRRPGRGPRRPGAERGLDEGRVLAAALRARVLPAPAPRAGRVELPRRLQDAALHDAGARDRDGHAGDGASAAGAVLLAAQRRLLRRLLLRLARASGALRGAPSPGREPGAAAPSRRAGGAVSEDAGASDLRAVLYRGYLRVSRAHA